MSLIVKHKFEKSKPFFNHKFHFCVTGKSAKNIKIIRRNINQQELKHIHRLELDNLSKVKEYGIVIKIISFCYSP